MSPFIISAHHGGLVISAAHRWLRSIGGHYALF